MTKGGPEESSKLSIRPLSAANKVEKIGIIRYNRSELFEPEDTKETITSE